MNYLGASAIPRGVGMCGTQAAIRLAAIGLYARVV